MIILTAISHEGFGSNIDEYRKVYTSTNLSNINKAIEVFKRKFSLEFSVPLDSIKVSILEAGTSVHRTNDGTK